MVVAVNLYFLGKGEGGGGTNYCSRDHGRGGGGEPRSRGGGGSSIGGICSSISAAVIGTIRIVSLILLSRLCILVGVYPTILS